MAYNCNIHMNTVVLVHLFEGPLPFLKYNMRFECVRSWLGSWVVLGEIGICASVVCVC